MHSVDKVLPSGARSCPKLCVVTDMVVICPYMPCVPMSKGLGVDTKCQ